MFKLKIYHGDAVRGLYCEDGWKPYWEEPEEVYETREQALVACLKKSLEEVTELMQNAEPEYIYLCENVSWFETYHYGYEIPEDNENELLEDVDWFDVATLFYEMPPWAREGNCDIEVETGYMIIELNKED